MSKKKVVFNAYELLNSPEMSAYLDQHEAEQAEKKKQYQAEMTSNPRLIERAAGLDKYTPEQLRQIGEDAAAERAPLGEKVARVGRNLYGNVAAGSESIMRGAGDVGADMLDAVGADEMAQSTRDYWRGRSDGLKEYVRENQPQFDSRVASSLYSGVESTARMAPGLVASVLAGSPSAMLGYGAADAGAGGYSEAREAGYNPAWSALNAANQAGAEYITEKIPAEKLIGDLAQKSGLFKTLGHQIATEVPGENVATLLQDASNQAYGLDGKKKGDWSQYAADRPGAAMDTTLATIAGTGIHTGAAHAINRAMGQEAATQEQPQGQPQQGPQPSPSEYDPIAPNQQALLRRMGIEADPVAEAAVASVESSLGKGDPTAGLVASVMRGDALQPIHDIAAVRANTILPVGSNEGGLYEPQWLPDAEQGESANGLPMPKHGFDSQEKLLGNARLDARDADLQRAKDEAFARYEQEQQQAAARKPKELERVYQDSIVPAEIERADAGNKLNQALASASGEGVAVPNAMQLALQKASARQNQTTAPLATDGLDSARDENAQKLPTSIPSRSGESVVAQQQSTPQLTTAQNSTAQTQADAAPNIAGQAPNIDESAPNVSGEPALSMHQNERGQWLIKGDMAQHAQTIREALPGTKLVVSQQNGQALVQMPADKNTAKQGKDIRKALDHLVMSGEQLAQRDKQRADASERLKARNQQTLQIDHSQDDILQAVAKLGGIDTEQALSEWWRGQAETVGHYNAEVPGNLRRQGAFAFKRGGQPIDTVIRRLEGEGYLPEGATPNDLLDALENRSLHPTGMEERARREYEARAEEESANAPGEFKQAYDEGRFADEFSASELEADGFFDLNRKQREAAEAAAEAAAIAKYEQENAEWDALLSQPGKTHEGMGTEEILNEIFGPETTASQDSQSESTAGQTDASRTRAGVESGREDGGQGSTEAQGSGDGFSLASYTEGDIQRQEREAEQRRVDDERQRAAADKARQDEETRKEIRRRSEAAADSFTLGGNAEDNLTGQGGLFDAPGNANRPGVATISKSDGSGFATREALRTAATKSGIEMDRLIEKRDDSGNWIGTLFTPDSTIDGIIADAVRMGKLIGTSVRDLHADDVRTVLMAAHSAKQLESMAGYLSSYSPRAAAETVQGQLDTVRKWKGWATDESLYGGGLFDALAETESQRLKREADALRAKASDLIHANDHRSEDAGRALDDFNDKVIGPAEFAARLSRIDATPAPNGKNSRFEQKIKIAANGVESLRASDVDRVLEQQQSPESLQALADYITQHRPDLSGTVQRDTAALKEENGWSEGPKRGKVGMMLAPGEVVLTASGRETTPFPKFQTRTGKTTARHLAEVDKWLLQNAATEALSRGDTFNAPAFQSAADNPKNISQSEKDGAEEYLFGEQPAVKPSILKPLVGANNAESQSSSAQNTEHSSENIDETPQDAAISAETAAPIISSKTPLIDAHEKLMASVRDGNATADQFKSSFDTLVNNADAIKAELEAKTKVELLRQGGPWVQMRYANEKKAMVVDAVYRQMVGEYSLGESVTYGMGKGAYEAAVRKMVDATDADKLASYKQDREAAIAEAKSQSEARAAAVENPKTLSDFREAINAKIRGGMTRKEAFLSLTPERRIQYDTLEAENTRDARETRKRALKTQIRTAGQTTAGEVIAAKHTKYGHDLFVVQLSERVSREDYNTLNASAKRMGGSYSSFRGNGAVPGFQFRTREAAEAFGKLVAGDTSAANAVANERRDAFEDDRSQSAVERLRAMAEKLDSQADSVEGQSRKTNTARRARFASAALAEAAADRAKAKTMLNIAQAIEDGRAKFLDEVRTKSQVDMLSSIVATAKDNELRAKYQSYTEQEKRKGEPPTAETADFAEFPSYTAFRSDLAALGRQMLEVDGTKKLGQRLMSVADDVTDAYMEFAKSHITDLSQFGTKGGGLAIFSSRDTAEKAIKRSGLTGMAIVLPVKRGENRVILSPSEAIQRGIWTGDGDKRITLTGEFGAEMVEAIGRRGNNGNKLSVPWQFQSAYDRRKALARIGIETPSEYRSALREFIALKEQAISNRVRDMELQMVGRKADGLDFFPTSAEVADQMMDAADIEPNMAVLEPSAGMGHLADRIRAAGAEPDVIEISPERRALLEEKGYHVSGVDDFMEMKPRQFFTYGDVFRATDGKEGVMRGSGGMGSQRVRLQDESGKDLGIYNRDELTGIRHNGTDSGYDRIIMNPPFSGRRDAEHVRHAYDLLKPGGRIVAIMGEGVFFGSDKKAQEFRDWLDSVGGTSEKLPEGSFMDTSLPVTTSVNARMVVLDKPESGGVLHSKANDYTSTKGMSAKDLQAIIAKALPAHLRERVKVEQSRSNNAQQSAQSEDNDLVEADYDLSTKQITLYADAIPTPERALFVLSHELTHYGLDAKYGFGLSNILLEARNNPMIAKLAAAIAVDRSMTVNSVRQDIADAMGLPVARVARSAAIHRLQVETANEALAELNAAIERNDFAYLQDRYGVAVPKMMRNDLRGRLSRLAASVKAWLAKLTGKQATDYSDKQVWDLLAGVRETVRNGENMAKDWRENAGALRSTSDSAEPIPHSVVAERIASTFDEARSQAKAFQGKPITNSDTGMVATVSRNGLDKMLSGKAVGKSETPALHSLAVANLDSLFEHAILGWSKTDNAANSNLALVHRMFAVLQTETGPRLVKLTVKEHALADQGNKIYTVEAIELNEKSPAAQWVDATIKSDGLDPISTRSVGDVLTIAQAVQNGNSPQRLSSTAQKQPASAGFSLPEETKTQTAQREVQDNMNRWKQVLENVREQGGQVDEQNDVSGAEERLHGRAATRIEDFARDEVEPLMQRLADSGNSLQEVGQYLLAQHAEEANARVREIDDSRDTAYGMEDGEAQSILAKFAAMPNAAEFKRLANDFRRISEGTLSLYVKAGIVAPEAAHAMRMAYQFYVPVKGGDEDQAARQGTGKGLSVNGKQKRRMGHDMRDEHVLENMLRDRQRAIVLAEKNNVGTYLLDLIERNPDPKLWTVDVLPKQKVLRDKVAYVVERDGQMVDTFNSMESAKQFIQAEAARTGVKSTSFAVWKSSDPYVTMMAKPVMQDHEVQVYVQGQPVRIQLHDPILAGQYRRMGTEQMGRIIEAGKSLNRWLSKVYTGYNPEFFVKNVVRDLFAGTINLTADQGAKVTAKALLHWPKAGAAMFHFALHGKAPSGEYGKALQRYRAAGGSTGAAYMGDLERQADTLNTLYENYSGAMAAMQEGKPVKAAKIAARKLVNGLAHWFEVWNQAGENAFRLATFMAMQESGKTVAESASMAKNVTVNFNRKGELTPQLGGLYLFFNPGVQGTARLWQSLAGKDTKHKRQAWALVGSMAGAALALAMMNRGDDGDEWEAIPDSVKDRNLIIPLGNKRKLTIPLPYGYSFFVSMANRMDAVMHGESAEKASIRLASSLFENFSPVGNPIGDDPKGENLISMLPTAMKMVLQPAFNINDFGSPMRPEYNASQPDNEKMWRGTRGSLYDRAAQGIAALHGSPYENNWNDVSPETIKYWVKTLTGGTGAFMADSASLLNVLASGSAPDVSEVPFVRSAVRESTVKDMRAKFNELGKEAKGHVDAWKRAVDAGDDKAAGKYEQDGELMALGEMLSGYKEQASTLRDLMAEEMKRDDLSLSEKRLKQKMYEKQEADVYSEFIQQFKH